jgi:simple sugar transport system substrate-binding protein
MPLRLHRRDLLAGAAATTAVSVFGRHLRAQEPLKVGFVYVGPVGDHGWTYRHDIGRQAVEDQFGDRVETTFVESVNEGPDAERVVRQLAASGHGLVFTTSFGFMNATVRVAEQFPDARFEHCTGYKRLDNLATYAGRFYEGRAIVGTMAGRLTETGKVGYIGSFPIPEVIRGINATAVHLRKVNPEATVTPIWVNSWYDPGKEAEAARALIDQGIDVITQHTDSPAPVQVAEERGLPCFGQASDMRRFAPNSQVTAIIDDWGPYYVRRVGELLDGNWRSGDTWAGIGEGMVVVADYGPMATEAMIAEADDLAERIASGAYHPFTGPIAAQDGSVLVPEGEVASDEQLLGMSTYAEGVVGSIPG